MRTAELTGPALDWAVAYALVVESQAHCQTCDMGVVEDYSTDWAQGGPLLEREGITIYEDPHWYGGSTGTPRYLACKSLRVEEGRYYSELTGSDPACLEGDFTQSGTSYLIAAMRCYVASKSGDEIEIPQELI